MNWPCLLISSLLVLLAAACSTTSDDPREDIMHGSIDYPFAARTNPLGHNGPSDKFVIRSTVGGTEYAVEIPGAARDYDIEVPIASLKDASSTTASATANNVGHAAKTDRELVAAMPKAQDPEDRAFVEGAFGVGEIDGPKQSPSFTLRMVKIKKLYKQRQYEFALIELNNLLTYYPSSPKLQKMKGTVLLKLRSYALAEQAWSRALELAPQDSKLRRGLTSLRNKIRAGQTPPAQTAH